MPLSALDVFDVAAVLGRAERDFEDSIERLCALLSIPSISTQPEHAGDVRRAASWLGDTLRPLGFSVTIHDTPGHPILVAHHPGAGVPGAPHILYYGHYDVQPAEPLALWTSPPFEPTVIEAARGRRVVARGAVDDKGQVMTFIEAFRAWHAAHGTLPVPVTVLLEGEEETGSPNLAPFLEAHRDALRADVCIVTDTNSWDIETPAITTRLRGMVYLEVTIAGPAHDLHSGLFGGAVLNPIHVLTRILGSIHDADGRVAFPGFYDAVRQPSTEEQASWTRLAFDESAFLAGVGLTTATGERGYGTLERLWGRPTCDVNGIWGGYTGAGSKTVIPAHASAKLSCRLVPDQDPEQIRAAVESFFRVRLPADARLEVRALTSVAGIEVPTTSPFVAAARAGLRRVYGRDAVLIGSGGSIPVVGHIRRVLGQDSILVGFGLDDDLIHSPNEKFEIRCYYQGIMSHIAILGQLSALTVP